VSALGRWMVGELPAAPFTVAEVVTHTGRARGEVVADLWILCRWGLLTPRTVGGRVVFS